MNCVTPSVSTNSHPGITAVDVLVVELEEVDVVELEEVDVLVVVHWSHMFGHRWWARLSMIVS